MAAITAITAIGPGPAQAAPISWTGGTGFWDIASNWSSSPQLPGAADDVLLGTSNTTFRTGVVTIQSFNGTGTLSITGGALTNTLASTTGGLNLSAGAIGGAGNIDIGGVWAWTGGTMAGTGTTTAGTVTISGANAKGLAGGRTVNAGNTTWSGNTGNGNNAINISGASNFNSSGTFTDANTFDSAINVGNGGGAFSNLGTFDKQSNTTTSIGTVFNNAGTVNVNAGTMLLGGGGTSTGAFNIAAGAKLEFRNGAHTLNNVTTSGAGTFEISTENVGADATVLINGGTHTTPFVMSGSTLAGSSHTFQGVAAWTGGTITGTAGQATTFTNALTISGATGKTLSGGRNVNAGNTTWTGNTGNGNNVINIATGSSFISSGTFTDANPFDSAMLRGNGGGAFTNLGTFNKQSNTTTSIGTAFNNNGTVNVNAGTMLMTSIDASTSNGGVFNIAAGTKLEFRNGAHTLNNVTTSGAGTFEISTDNVGGDASVAVNGGTHTTPFVFSGSTMTGTDATFRGLATWTGGSIFGAATTTFDNNVTISGVNTKVIVGGRTVVLNGTTTWSGNTANNNNAIQFWNGATVNNNGTFNDANAFGSFIEHSVGGPHNFNNLGTYNKQSNTLTTVDLGVGFNNSGTLNLNAGTMLFASGTQGPTGTVRVAPGATFQIGAASTAGNMITAGNLTLADRTLTVFLDYDNANFGVGNAFNRRANVTVSGAATPRLIAAGDANQTLTGANVINGNTANPTLQIGNVRIGSTTYTYNITNSGTTGPALRGAIQDAVNGGSITDPRLSGNGVQAGNWGPIGPGASIARDVTITIANAGALGPINGQGVAIVNNFENTRSQVLNIGVAAGAAAYQVAAGAIQTAPLNFGTLQVGQQVSQSLVVRNTASGPGGFVEDLNASFGASGSSQISGTGSLTGIRAGTNSAAANGAMTVTVTGGTAGALSSGIAVNYASAGAVNGVSNGLGTLAVGSETYGVSGTVTAVGNVINQASPLVNTPTINLGAVRVGAAAPTGAVSITNVATAAPQAALNASIAPTSGPITASGSFSLLNPGATNSTSLVVGLNTGTAGNFTGANAARATVSLVSDAGNVGNCAPNCQLNLGPQVVNVEGKVYAAATGQATGTVIDFGIVRVGDTVSARNITINNTAAVAALNDTLRASLGGLSGPFTGNGATVGGIAAQGSAQLGVGLATANAGQFSQAGQVSFLSQNADLADISGGAAIGVSVQAQVNNLADAVFNLRGGLGTLTRSGNDFILDFGTLNQGVNVASQLDVANSATGTADALDGRFILAGASALMLSGFDSIDDLLAGTDTADMGLAFTAGSLGLFEQRIGLDAASVNASDPLGLALARFLVVRATVVAGGGGGGGTVPEPGTLALMLSAVAAGWATRRRTGRAS